MALIDNVDLLNQIFDGFVPCNARKAPTVKQWNINHTALTNVIKSNNYGGIINEKYVCIDCDDPASINMVTDVVKTQKLNCLAIKTTKGVHFYFKNEKKQATK
ncbi:MAG: hypothetical protein M0R51_17790, partial [Clostridia bacterium]|nr:hypothetical protein [Clostridia bacterium]